MPRICSPFITHLIYGTCKLSLNFNISTAIEKFPNFQVKCKFPNFWAAYIFFNFENRNQNQRMIIVTPHRKNIYIYIWSLVFGVWLQFSCIVKSNSCKKVRSISNFPPCLFAICCLLLRQSQSRSESGCRLSIVDANGQTRAWKTQY